jgi:hypothetical protein
VETETVLRILVREVLSVLQPLRQADATALVARLLPSAGRGVDRELMQRLISLIQSVVTEFESIDVAIASSEVEAAASVARLAERVRLIVQTWTRESVDPEHSQWLAELLLQLLLMHLICYYPRITAFVTAIGLLRVSTNDPTTLPSFRPSVLRQWIENPAEMIASRSIVPTDLVDRPWDYWAGVIFQLLRSFSCPVEWDADGRRLRFSLAIGDSSDATVWIQLQQVSGAYAFSAGVIAAADFRVTLGTWVVSVSVVGQPSVQIPPISQTPALHGSVQVSLSANTSSARFATTSRGFRLEVSDVLAGFEASTEHAVASARIGRATILVDPPSNDSFLSSVLPSDRFRVDTSVGVEISSRSGVVISGAGSLVWTRSIRASLGPAILDSIALGLRVAETSLTATASASVSVQLGPIRASVGDFGIESGIEFRPGSAGGVDFLFRLVPPKSVGLSIRTGAIAGAGFIRTVAPGDYDGAISIELGTVSLNAVVLVRSDREQSSFSLLALLRARFPSIPLGLGFMLNGVGGLLALHRTANLSALRSAVLSRQLSSLTSGNRSSDGALAEAAQLAGIFPAARDRFVVAPIAVLQYGPPIQPLVEATVAVVIGLPQPVQFALLGDATSELPSRSTPTISLTVALVGTVDIAARTVAIDASLRDSRIGPLNLYGDLAFRLGWGEQPYFLLSIGGFNPHFQAPSNFPTLRRLTLGYTAPGGLVRLRIESYFAITSNTLQLGARIEVQVRIEIVSIDGMLAFDALVIFSPFSFRIDFLASLSVTVFGAKLLAIHLEGTIKGPKPWHVTGKARLSVLFIEAAVDVDVKFGGEPSLEELPAVDPTGRLLEALRAPASWKGELMAGVSRPVSLSDASNSDTPLFDPVGVPAVRQTIVPLNRKLDRYAEGRIGGPGRYDVRAARVGTAPATHRPAHELFAAAQFEQMTDAEKLSRPSFEKMDAGALLASEAISVGPKAQGAGLFEQIKLGDDETPTTATLPSEQILASSRSGAASLRGLRVQGADRFAPPPSSAPRVALADELYVAVRRDSLRPAERATPETAGAASALVQLLAEESGGASLFQVAPAFEATGGDGR